MAVSMRVTHLVLLAQLLFVNSTLSAQPLAAQEGADALIGQEFGSYPLRTDFIVKAYTSADPKNNHLFLTPFFAFEADNDGKLVVRLDDSDSKGRRRVTINLLAYPQRQKEEIANRIQINEQFLVPHGRFAHVRPDDLITLGFRNLSITEVSDDPVFKSLPPRDGVTNQGRFELTADLPAAKAKDFKDALSDGRRSLTFEIRASLNARRVQNTAILTAQTAEVRDSKAYKILTGTATLFRTGVQGGVTVAPSAVMRNQRDRIAAEIRKDLESRLIIDGTVREIEWLKRQFDGFMERAFKPAVIQQDFGQAAARLYAYDFEPGDLKPDQIAKIVANVQDTFKKKEEEHEFKEAETSANAMFGVFSGTGNFRIKTDRLEELMRDNGWKFELDGDVKVPKSLEVYIVDLQAFQVAGSISMLIEEGQRGVVVYQETFSTARRLDPSKPVVQEPWAELVALQQKVNKLQKQGEIEASRLTNHINSSFKYKSINIVIAAQGKAIPQDIEVPFPPGQKTHRIEIPEAKELFAVWYTTIDAVYGQSDWHLIDPIINKDPLRIDLALVAKQPGGRIRIVVHVIYR